MTLAIGIDLGTSAIKAVLMEDARVIRAVASRPIAVSIPQVGHAEHNPDDWVRAVFACLDEIAAAEPALMGGLVGIGLSGQMLSCLILDRDLRPIRPAMLWNDQRAIAECADLLAAVPDIGRRTNGTPDPGITAPKLMWLARNEPEAFARAHTLLLAKDYVRLALTGELATEPTDAGGTQLFDVATHAWDERLCAAVGWTAGLPQVSRAWLPGGGLRPALAERWGLRAGLPVATGAGDNMGSTLGAGGVAPGDAVLTIGTSAVACIVDRAFHPGPEKAILTSAHAVPDTFLSMGVVMTATAALDWTARLGGTDAGSLAGLAEGAEARLATAPLFLPCLNGIRTPANRPNAQGTIVGLHPGVDLPLLGLAAMEGVAYQIAACIAAQRAVGVAADAFRAVGGGTRSGLWMRLLATALGRPVALPEGAEMAGPGGAARLATSAATGDLSALYARPAAGRVIDPDPALATVVADRQGRFEELLQA